MIAHVMYFDMDKLYPIVQAEGWGSDNPLVVAYNKIQFPETEDELREAVSSLIRQGAYRSVADLYVTGAHEDSALLETVFHDTQNITHSWTHNRSVVKMFGDDEERSMSVGDLVRMNGGLYVVRRMGFSEV